MEATVPRLGGESQPQEDLTLRPHLQYPGEALPEDSLEMVNNNMQIQTDTI